MLHLDKDSQTLIELGVWSRPLTSDEENGDGCLVKGVPGGVLIAVVDGLGHGREAAVAAQAAISYLDMNAGDTVISLFQKSHEFLRKTRGAVMSLAIFNGTDDTVTWLGVGNVEGVLLRRDSCVVPSRESILLRGGVVGLQLPQLYATVMPVFRGDVLIFATDGISNRFSDGLTISDSPQRLANRIGSQFYKGTDDALVMVTRYCGRSHDSINS
jgi:serine/threonine protein phosphatase PrpC